MDFVRAEPALRKFLDFEFPCQSFNTSVRLLPEGQSRFSSKDRMQIEGRLDRTAYLASLWRSPKFEEHIVGNTGDLTALRRAMDTLLQQYGIASGMA